MSKIQLINKALKIGHLCVVFKRVKGNWVAAVPSKQDRDGSPASLSKVYLCDWNNQGLRRLRFLLASRYLAQVYEDSMCAHINLRWALKLPNWSMSGRYGAMGELASAMKRAGLI